MKEAALHITVNDFVLLTDGVIDRVLEAEQRYLGLEAAVKAEPDLEAGADALQRLRAQLAAAKVGIELRGDGRPFPAEVVKAASGALRRSLLRPGDADAL